MTKARALAAAAATVVAGAAALLISTSKPAPVAAPVPAVQTSAVRPLLGAAAVSPTVLEAASLVTLPNTTKPAGYVWLGPLPVQKVPAAIAAAVAASPQQLARWKGSLDTFWAQPDRAGRVQCFWTDSAGKNRGLVYCDRIPTTFVWHPVVIQ